MLKEFRVCIFSIVYLSTSDKKHVTLPRKTGARWRVEFRSVIAKEKAVYLPICSRVSRLRELRWNICDHAEINKTCPPPLLRSPSAPWRTVFCVGRWPRSSTMLILEKSTIAGWSGCSLWRDNPTENQAVHQSTSLERRRESWEALWALICFRFFNEN